MWLSKLKLVLPEQVLFGSLRLENGRIAEIVEGNVPGGLDAQGLTAIPGIVDMHGDMLERELEPRPGTLFPAELALYELDKRLVGNGVTTAYAAVSFSDGPGLRSEERALALIQAIHQFRSRLLSDLRVHARFEVTTPHAAPILMEKVGKDEIHLVSLMDHSPGQGQFRDMETYVRYYARWLGSPSSQVEAVARQRAEVALQGPKAWQIGREVAAIAQQQGLPLASHDDDTPQKIALMTELGTSISEFPVTLEAAQEAKRRGMWVVMGAPNALRGGSHSGNLSALEGIQAGVVDALAADYHPGSLLQAAWRLVAQGILPLHQSVRLITHNVAQMCGLHDRGQLAVGLRADLVLVEEGNLPRVRGTLQGGRFVYRDGTV